MRAFLTVVGMEWNSFAAKETGELIQYCKAHVISKANGGQELGYRTNVISVAYNLKGEFKVFPGEYEVDVEQKKSGVMRIVNVISVKETEL